MCAVWKPHRAARTNNAHKYRTYRIACQLLSQSCLVLFLRTAQGFLRSVSESVEFGKVSLKRSLSVAYYHTDAIQVRKTYAGSWKAGHNYTC